MEKKEYKFASEGSVLMFLDKYQILQQTELKEYAKHQKTFTEQNPCNLYFILKRPRVTIDPKSFQYDTDSICIDTLIQVQNQNLKFPIRLANKNQSNKIRLDTEYPYSIFSLYDNNDEHLLTAKTAVLLDAMQYDFPINYPLLDFEVLYIGQSIGEDGKRTAIDRLYSHNTLQKIYSEAISRNPDSEIWLMLTSFRQKNVASVSGHINITEGTEKENFQRFLNFAKRDYLAFSDQQKITFTEAALIRCFEPQYNIDYKDTFPSPSHSSYSECYKLDINAIVIQIDTSEIKRCLYTKKKDRRLYQHEVFYLPTEHDRWKMFNIE